MRAMIIVWWVGFAIITLINLSAGVGLPPWWFVLFGLVLTSAFWWLGGKFMKRSE
jgi:hypothetical protein